MRAPIKAGLALTTTLLLVLALLYRPELEPERLEPLYSDGASRWAEVRGLRLHYKDEGSGPPVLLLHGTGSSLHTWDGWVERLSTDFRLIRPDIPGFGLTGPDPTGDCSAERRVEILAALLDRLGVERSAVAGNSLGGLLALKFAMTFPERTDRLVLLNAAGHPYQVRGGMTMLDLAAMPVLGGILSRITPRFVVARAVREVYQDASLVTPDLIQRHYDLLRRRGNREALRKGLATEWTLEREAIRSLEQPTLILWGASDRLIAAEVAELFHQDIPDSQLVVYGDAGHVPMEETPAQSGRDVRAFLTTAVESNRPPG
jgi:pimeloyl-ACP methyl ester carboxylesterase